VYKRQDEGKGFDYHNLPDPTAPENILKENGRGIFLMKNLSDEIEFNDSGNEVTIYFGK
jgi:serine/threonine-protein kinase RsbW